MSDTIESVRRVGRKALSAAAHVGRAVAKILAQVVPTPLDLAPIEARLAAASPWPWHAGDPFLEAAVGGDGLCDLCRSGEDRSGELIHEGVWENVGMPFHRHVRSGGPDNPEHALVDANGVTLTDHQGIAHPGDTAFIAHAPADVAALIDEVRRLETKQRDLQDKVETLEKARDEHMLWSHSPGDSYP